MTDEKVLEVIERYETVTLVDYTPKRDNEAQEWSPRLHHLRWMCDQIRIFLAADRRDKAFRWLGFIQGAFWVMGIRSVNDMKDDNRPPGEDFNKDH